MKTSSSNKLPQNRTVYKKIGTGNTTQLSNLTKYSLNHNTTKLSLGDKTLGSNKLGAQNQSTTKKNRWDKNVLNLKIDDRVEKRLNEIEKIRTSLTMVIKKNGYVPV